MFTPVFPDDDELLEQLKQDNAEAYELLYHRYKGLLYVHAYKRLQDREEVSDIIQEIFLKLWEKRRSLTITTNFSGWLYQAVRYKIIDRFSRRQTAEKYVDSFQQYLGTHANATDHPVREKMLNALIQQEIASLPPKMRMVFELSRQAHLSHREIAQQLNISEQSVRSHIKNALRILRVRFGLYLLFMLFQIF